MPLKDKHYSNNAAFIYYLTYIVSLAVPSLSLLREVNVSLPEQTRDNGTLFAVVYIHKAGVSPLEDGREVHYAAQLTTYIAPPHTEGQRDTHKVKCDSIFVLSYFSHLSPLQQI